MKKLKKTTDLLKIHTINGELFNRKNYQNDPSYKRECRDLLESFHKYGICFYYNPNHDKNKYQNLHNLGTEFMKTRMIDKIDPSHPEVCLKTINLFGIMTPYLYYNNNKEE